MNSARRTLLVLGFLVALGPFTVDFYIPAFPLVQADFGTSAAAVQLTLTATTIGFALGQLAIGPWSDSIGRRRPLLVATALHVAGSLGVAAAPTVEVMLVFRLLQGAGAAGSGVVALAMVRDLFDGALFVRMAARLAVVTGLAPVVAPFAGSLMLSHMSWRGLFVCIALYGLAVLAVAAFLVRETAPLVRRAGAPLGRYRVLVTDRGFVGAALAGGLLVSSVFTYMSSSSFLFQETYGLSAQRYSLVFAANAVGFVIGAQTSARLVTRIGPRRLLRYVLPSLGFLGFTLLLAAFAGENVVVVTFVTALYFLLAGAVGPCLQVIGMAPHGERAGTAAALMGAANFGLAGATAPVAGLLGVGSIGPIGLVMGLTMTVAVVVFRVLARDRREARAGAPSPVP
ncbi:drug resistance transporter, Bcr/CflA subfamily [Parafrankia sp. EAN1pec]|uniref:multidrug effflux MFS transporter n=1 Tax=Parafrankia sp. (strain EAN1pec) TaxID=298653 RepID=UPI0000543EE5|nr:drug resistance transporter, Bcr/CflA subfamily [Frankia sp. EAN1pec]